MSAGAPASLGRDVDHPDGDVRGGRVKSRTITGLGMWGWAEPRDLAQFAAEALTEQRGGLAPPRQAIAPTHPVTEGSQLCGSETAER